jgi:hypothetical protein
LKALGVVLAALATMIGIAAIGGHQGISDSVTDAATKRVKETMGSIDKRIPTARAADRDRSPNSNQHGPNGRPEKTATYACWAPREIERPLELPSYPGGPKDVSTTFIRIFARSLVLTFAFGSPIMGR